MTTKKTLKKLTLKKESIANLNNDELSQLRGGVTWTTISSLKCVSAVSATVYATAEFTNNIASIVEGYTTYANARSWPTAHDPDACKDEDYIYDGGYLSEIVVTP